MSVALYLDRTSEQIERLLMEEYPLEGVEYKFLDPFVGPKGTLEEADYYFATNYKVTKEVMEQSPKLKLIVRTGVGFENVDIEYAKSRNIPVTIATGANAVSVAEMIVAFMLNCARKFCFYDRSTKEGKWYTWEYRHETFDLQGKTLGVIGAGLIAREVFRRVRAFGVNCVYYDMFRLKPEQEEEYGLTYMSTEKLLEESDFVMAQVPCNAKTTGMLGREQFKRMKKTAYIINAARGPIVDEEALIWALDNKEIAGAALDVFNVAPLPKDHKLLTYPNVITTPHIGGSSFDAYRRNFAMCTKNIRALEKGEKLEFVVNGL